VFDVMIIPFTWANTALPSLKVHDRVNLECDMIGKYVARAVALAEEEGRLKRPYDVSVGAGCTGHDDMTKSIRIAKGARKRRRLPRSRSGRRHPPGEMIIVCDDETARTKATDGCREKVTAATINFMAKHGAGRSALDDRRPPRRARHPLAVSSNTTTFGTASACRSI